MQSVLEFAQMKSFLVWSFAFLFSAVGVAANDAANRSYSFCDDITKIDKLLNRTFETSDRLLDERVNVDRIVVSKDRKILYLVSGDSLLRQYNVAFGTNPEGHKQFEGDRKTPEGMYTIDYKNPKSEYTKALHISYPNKKDLEFAKSQGKSAGGAIMVHGFKPDSVMNPRHYKRNWTHGCVAVTTEEIEEIYSLVKVNTLIEICSMSPKEVEVPEAPPLNQTESILDFERRYYQRQSLYR